MKQKVGPYQIEMEKMGFRDDETNVWWPKFKCPKCGEKFYAFLEEILLGDIYLCPKCGEYPIHVLEQKEEEQRRKRTIKNDAIQKGIVIGKEQKDISKKIRQMSNKKNINFASKGELLISEILRKYNIAFYSQYNFSDCINPLTNKPLFFDFYLPDYNCCIEYDGEQHYELIQHWGGKAKLKKQQQRDSVKNKYCEDNNIILIRIKYDCSDIENYLLQKLSIK